jgi:uncharacterized protein (TIGR03435 family)
MRRDTRVTQLSGVALGVVWLSVAVPDWSAGESTLHAQGAGVKFTTASVTRSQSFLSIYPVVEEGRFAWQAAPLVKVIEYAYEATSPTLEGKVPLDPMYDIDATFPTSATPREIKDMVKNLLADQFTLRVHHETRRMPIWRLIQASGGHKLGAARAAPTVSGRSLTPGRISFRTTQFVGARVTVRQIADALANFLRDRPVVDATGVSGTFDVNVVQPDATDSQAFLETVPGKLGLKLEPAIDNVQILVVDSFKMP